MRTRAWWMSLGLAAAAAACGDQPTEVVPERGGVEAGPGTVALATSSTEDGLSITTDKDDYAPGDTVWFTGAGWPAGDTLDIVLTDEPLTHPPHEWWVPVDGSGGFRDSTYVVDVGDVGVTFTLTATSRGTGRALTVQFTDGVITFTSFTFFPAGASSGTPPNGCTGASGTSVQTGTPICALAAFNITLAGATPVSIRWKNPSGTVVAASARSPNFPNLTSGAQTFSATFTPAVVGTWTALLCESSNTSITGAGAAGCQGGPERGSVTFTVTAPPAASKLAFITDPRTAAVGQCTAQIDVQSQLGDGTPANVTSNTSLTLSSTSAAGSFHTDAACTVSGSSAIAAGTHTATFYYKDTNVGTPTLTASATGLTQATQQQNITAGNALVAVTASPGSATVFGQSVSFTATVTAVAPAVGTPTGSVTFHDGPACSDAQIGGGKTLAGGTATSDGTSTLTVGSHTITACYGGGGGFGAQTGQLAHTVNKASTTTGVGSSINPSVFSQPVTFTVTVSVVAPGTGTPAGNVTLVDGSCAAGATLGGPTALNGSGQASFTVSTLTAASHAVTGCYAGNDDYAESDGFVTQVVDKAETSTGVTSNANPSVFSQTVTFEVTVTPVAPALATPVGNVTLKNGTCAAGVALGGLTALNGSGKASFSVSSLAVGSHTITGCYLGNSNFEASDGSISQEVNKAATSTSVTSNHNPSVFSQTVTFSVSVEPVFPAVAVPQGNVELFDGSCLAGTSLGGPTALDVNGEASFSVSTLSVGTHTITACYAGNSSFEESHGSVSQVVDKASTTTAITSSVNPSILAQPVTFSVTVSSVAPAVATPVGNVTLKDGTCAGTTIGGPTALNGSGQTSFTVSTLSVGGHTISACYAGDESFEPSENSLSQQVKYNFEGLFAPVDRPNTMNVSKAGQAIPLKWRLTDFNGDPVLDFSATALGIAVSSLSCAVANTLDQIEEYAGNSGLQNLGDGYYQYNWKTPPSYANSCRAIGLNLGEGSARGPLAYFNFKK